MDSAAQQPVTTTMLRKFAATARQRMRIEGGGYRRDHLRALAQRVEVADREVRIMGSKSDLLRTLAAISGVESAAGGVRSSVLDWRKGWDSNPRYPCRHGGFQDRCLKPLGHPSKPTKPRRYRTAAGLARRPVRRFDGATGAVGAVGAVGAAPRRRCSRREGDALASKRGRCREAAPCGYTPCGCSFASSRWPIATAQSG